MSTTYPLARQGIFTTIQGEGYMLGVPMVFVRLAGCSIGCPACDTDYKLHTRVAITNIVNECRKQATAIPCPWVWVTGGEPMDHNLYPLLDALAKVGCWNALATAGHKLVPDSWRMSATRQVSYLSVSPHDPTRWKQKVGNELKIVPGLNDFNIKDFTFDNISFGHKFVQPCEGKPESLAECFELVKSNATWRLSVQAHKQWGVL